MFIFQAMRSSKETKEDSKVAVLGPNKLNEIKLMALGKTYQNLSQSIELMSPELASQLVRILAIVEPSPGFLTGSSSRPQDVAAEMGVAIKALLDPGTKDSTKQTIVREGKITKRLKAIVDGMAVLSPEKVKALYSGTEAMLKSPELGNPTSGSQKNLRKNLEEVVSSLTTVLLVRILEEKAK